MTRRRTVWLRIAGLRVALRGVESLGDRPSVLRDVGGFAVSECPRPDVLVEILSRNQQPARWCRSGQIKLDGLGSYAVLVEGVGRARRVELRVCAKTAAGVVAAVHLGLARALGQRDGMLLHASAAKCDGGVVVFPGRSGAGKTTAVRSFGTDQVLCDERVAVRRRGSAWWAYSVPLWGGRYGPVTSGEGRLLVLVLIQKDMRASVRRLGAPEALAAMAPAVKLHDEDRRSAMRMLRSLERLVDGVPVLELGCRREDRVAELLDGSLAGGLGVPS